MKTYIIASLLQILLLLVMAENSAARCPNRYVSVGTGCYLFDGEDRVTWYQAYFKCKFNLNGTLVEITTQEEQNSLKQYIQNVIDPSGQYTFWIGASDLLLEGEYRWMSSGNMLSFNAWNARQGQPNNAGGFEDCVMMSKGTEYLWYDFPCTNTGDLFNPPLRAICEATPTK